MRRASVVIVALALVAAACGGGSTDTADGPAAQDDLDAASIISQESWGRMVEDWWSGGVTVEWNGPPTVVSITQRYFFGSDLVETNPETSLLRPGTNHIPGQTFSTADRMEIVVGHEISSGDLVGQLTATPQPSGPWRVSGQVTSHMDPDVFTGGIMSIDITWTIGGQPVDSTWVLVDLPEPGESVMVDEAVDPPPGIDVDGAIVEARPA